MKKFRVVVSYCGAIDLEIEAKNEIFALEKAERICGDMDKADFIEALELQKAGTEVEEIK